MSTELSAIVKSYDVRGLVATQLTPEVVYAIGYATCEELGLAGKGFIVGHDMRPSSPELARALEAGAAAAGAIVRPVGLASTDMVYFASGLFDEAAAMITASHNPPEYNGIKFSRAGAKGVSMNTGLAGIRDRAQALVDAGVDWVPTDSTPEITDVVSRYAEFLRGLVDIGQVRPLRIVVDAANGMAGYTVPAVLGTEAGLPGLPLEIDPMYFELDGTFPNHEANPLEPKNLVDLQARVVETGADMGLAFDGDADRCFVVDERGEPVTPSVIGSIVARREITRVQALGEDQPVVLHNLICSQVVPETITAEGGIAHRTAVGHSLIKDDMATTNAVFGAEHSAHYYFRDFFGADSGLLAALHVIAELGSQDQALSTLASRYMPYHQTGERNFRVEDVGSVMENIRNELAAEATIDTLDGLSVQGPMSGPDMWWVNVRASNTEPLLRVNAEAASPEKLADIVARVDALIPGA